MDFSAFVMENRYDAIVALPYEEMMKHWERVRTVMKKKNLDAAVLISYRQGEKRGIHQWLIGSKRVKYILFSLRENPIAVFGGKANDDGSFNRDAIPGMGKIINPLYDKVEYVNEATADMLTKLSCGNNRIGIYKPEDLTVGIRRLIDNAVPEAELIDITDDIDYEKMHRSEFEQGLLKESAILLQKVQESVPETIKRGYLYSEVMAKLTYLGLQYGSSAEVVQFFNEVYDNNGTRKETKRIPYPGAVYEEGDIVGILTETDGNGGYNSMTQRYYCLGEPSDDFKTRFKTADAANRLVGKLMKEGNTIKNIAEEVNQFIRDAGYYTDDCNYLHACGYATWDHPSKSDRSIKVPNIFASENMPLEVGQLALCHPHVGPTGGAACDRSVFIRCGSSYFVGKEEGVRSNDTPNQYLVI